MSTKHHLTTILIFVAIFLSCFSSNAQNSSDLIRAEKRGLGYIYYKDSVALNFNQVMQLTKSNPAAFKLMEEAKTMRTSSYIFGIPGGFALGYALGHALGCAMVGKKINSVIFYSTLGTGAVLVFVSIGLEIGANNKAKEAIAVFNNAIKQKNNANLDLGFSPGGVMLRLSF